MKDLAYESLRVLVRGAHPTLTRSLLKGLMVQTALRAFWRHLEGRPFGLEEARSLPIVLGQFLLAAGFSSEETDTLVFPLLAILEVETEGSKGNALDMWARATSEIAGGYTAPADYSPASLGRKDPRT